MKSCTDIEQSKKLAGILPIESADMHYARIEDDDEMRDWELYLSPIPKICALYVENLPCWSLAALLRELPETILGKDKDGYVVMVETMGSGLTTFADEPIDACYEMINKLNCYDYELRTKIQRGKDY